MNMVSPCSIFLRQLFHIIRHFRRFLAYFICAYGETMYIMFVDGASAPSTHIIDMVSPCSIFLRQLFQIFRHFRRFLVCFIYDFRSVLVKISRSGGRPLMSMYCLEIWDFVYSYHSPHRKKIREELIKLRATESPCEHVHLICWWSRRNTTASWLPPNCWSVNTSPDLLVIP